MIIAIDGPSGAGKSSVAKDLADRLGFSCLDTGAMYRAIAYRALESCIDLNNEDALTTICQNSKIEFRDDPCSNTKKIFLEDEDLTSKIRTAKIDKAVTPVCQFRKVRDALVEQQRRIVKGGDYILDGRDIASVVVPNAEFKIFLTADINARAQRRYKQNISEGINTLSFDEVLKDLKRRDHKDIHRKYSPLVKVEDAIVIDSTNLSKDEVVEKICKIINYED